MCIIFFTTHPFRPVQHVLGSYHCAHLTCTGRFEAHHKFLLEESESDCSACAKKAGVELDPDIVPVTWYPPVEDIAIKYVEGEAWIKVSANDTEKEDAKSLSDVDSVTSHWKEVYPTVSPWAQQASPSTLHRSLVEEQLAKLPQHMADRKMESDAPLMATDVLGRAQMDVFKAYPDVRRINGTGVPRLGQVVSGEKGTWAFLECGWVRM